MDIVCYHIITVCEYISLVRHVCGMGVMSSFDTDICALVSMLIIFEDQSLTKERYKSRLLEKRKYNHC